MALISAARIHRRVEQLARDYPGPGGAVAVLVEGKVLVRHSWGFANAERRIPFTPRSLFRMCSITKQFTSALLLDAFPDPATLDADVCQRLPLLEGPAPGALHLAHNQSGLRDYWAVAMLQGAPVESAFGPAEAQRLIGATRSLQFTPGTRYSYTNQNFRILSDILERRTGRSFAELLRARMFQPLGMETAFLAEDTRAMPDGTEGYEGTQEWGFRAAENRILWTGDAGLGASLDDLIAWEKHVDATRGDTAATLFRMAGPVSFADGAPAPYGFGLARGSDFDRSWVGHG
ncbi:MAG: serine hydrolase, partial [Pseudomonadota bacterium]